MFSGVISSEWQDVECGVNVRRLFPTWLQPSRDPFALLDEFIIEEPGGFPWHAHVGFEKITYVLSGVLQHVDAARQTEFVTAGGVHRLCAREPINHSELPSKGVKVHGIQLWIALREHHPGTCPAPSQAWESHRLPLEMRDFGEIVTVVGPGSPVFLHNQVGLREIRFVRDGWFSVFCDVGHESFVYVIHGTVHANKFHLKDGDLLEMSADGSHHAFYGTSNTRILVAQAARLGQTVRVHGSYVDVL